MPDDESEKLLITLIDLAFKKENISDIELKLINKNSKINYLSITAIPVYDTVNNLKGYRGIARNVTP